MAALTTQRREQPARVPEELLRPVVVCRLPVGDGEIGPVTRALQARYFALVRGEDGAYPEWRTAVWD
jgi:branched-chain amino acid aminotransferase